MLQVGLSAVSALSFDDAGHLLIVGTTDGRIHHKIPLNKVKRIRFQERERLAGGIAPREPLFDALVIESRDAKDQLILLSSDLQIFFDVESQKSDSPSPQFSRKFKPQPKETVVADQLGTIWNVTENGWNGEWKRNGTSNTFSGVWTRGSERGSSVLTITMTGVNTVSILRRDGGAWEGNEVEYSGTIAADGSVSGTAKLFGKGQTWNWSGKIR